MNVFFALKGSKLFINIHICAFRDWSLSKNIPHWPNFFLMNVFFALKGSKLFIIIPVCTTDDENDTLYKQDIF